MAEQFVTFQKFNYRAAALELEVLLKENNIEYVLEDTSSDADAVTFVNNELSKEFRIKLRKQDFAKADSLLQKIYSDQIDTVAPDYYLFDFTDGELMEIIIKRDEWGRFDFLLAQKLLKERGKEIKPEVVELIQKQRIQELARPEDSYKIWVYAGYIMAFLGGLMGILIGWHLWTHKKTLPNGDMVYGHSSSDRRHGIRIAIIGVVSFVIWVTIRIANSDWWKYQI